METILISHISRQAILWSFAAGMSVVRMTVRISSVNDFEVPLTTVCAGFKVARFSTSLKDAPQKMQCLGAIQKVASLNTCLKNAKWRKVSAELTVTDPE